MSREDLTRRDELAAAILAMRAEHTDPDELMMAIAGEADCIEDRAITAEDARYVSNRIERIMAKAGLLA
jgi:hypothetical protein